MCHIRLDSIQLGRTTPRLAPMAHAASPRPPCVLALSNSRRWPSPFAAIAIHSRLMSPNSLTSLSLFLYFVFAFLSLSLFRDRRAPTSLLRSQLQLPVLHFRFAVERGLVGNRIHPRDWAGLVPDLVHLHPERMLRSAVQDKVKAHFRKKSPRCLSLIHLSAYRSTNPHPGLPCFPSIKDPRALRHPGHVRQRPLLLDLLRLLRRVPGK